MTDQELTNAVAIEVMGWDKPDGFCSKQGWDKNVLWWNPEKKGYVDPFDPLRDHNHAALARKKMRERGFWLQIIDIEREFITKEVVRGVDVLYYIPGQPSPDTAWHVDELRAECEAMIEAVRKDR